MKKALFCFIFLMAFKSVISQVTIDFTANTRVGCGVVQVAFQNKSTGPIKSYSWNLGGIVSAVENPSRIFISPGKYNICLTVTDVSGKSETLCKNEFIEVKPSFKADFISTESLICAGTSSEFKDLSVSPNGKITTVIWDLGGSTGTIQLVNSVPVSSTYKDPGLYAVTLYVKDEAGCESTITKKDILRVLQKPEIKINIPAAICNVPADVNVNNLSPKTPELTFQWNFGNGISYTGFDPPPVRFNQEGKYDLKVIARNSASNCSDSLIQPGAFVVEKMAKFIVNRRNACLNDAIQFSPLSTIQPETHFWDFGDGMTSNMANPQHAYRLPGCYTVTHNTIYQGCTSIQVLDTCIRIYDLPQPAFVLDKTRGCQFPLLVQTTNNSSTGIEWTWSSNGVFLSNEKNPVLRFDSPGLYPIQLEVKNAEGCKATVGHGPIEGYKIQPRISSGAVKGCGPLFYTLEHNSLSADPITLIRWTVFTSVPKVVVGPVAALIIPETGQYNVRLVIENTLGCKDSVEEVKWIQVGRPPATAMEFTNQICFGLPLNLMDKSDSSANEFLWEFGDGLDPDGSKNPVKTYLEPKIYTITHQAFFNGCPGNRVSENVQILGAKADFEIQNNCNTPNSKAFLNKSVGADSVQWDFGVTGSAGDTNSQLNSRFNYPMPGGYAVTLKVFHKASHCEDTAVLTAIVSKLNASFKLNSNESCTPAEIQIINTSQDVSGYQYLFAGAEISNPDTSDPVVRYTHGGNYAGRLIGTDQLGCRDTFDLADSIRIHEIQVQAMTSHQNFCQDSTVKLMAINKSINDRISSYTWTFGNQSIDNKPEIEVTIDSVRTHQVILSAISVAGCKVESKLTIESSHIRVDFITDTLICKSDSIRFSTLISGHWNKVFWNFGDGDSTNQINPSHRYTSDGFYSVRLTVKDDLSGCSQTKIKNDYIRIHDPIAAFEVLNAQEFCPPFIGKVSNHSQFASDFEWIFGEGSGVSTEYEPSRLFTESGSYKVRLIAKSSDRCTDTSSIESAFIVNGPEINFIKELFPKVCTPLPVNYLLFNNGVNLIGIEYGDGYQDVIDGPAKETPFKHTYDTGGLFYSVIFATDTFGCTSFKLLDTILLHEVIPRLGFENNLICGSEGYLSIKNESASSDPITELILTLDGNNTQTRFPNVPDSVFLDQFGYYSLKLVMGSAFCKDSIQYLDTIHLTPAPATNFEISNALLCEGDSITLINRSTAINEVINLLEWKISNQRFSGTTVDWKLAPGNLDVKLIAGTENGCRDSLEREYLVNPSVRAIISSDTLICAGALTHLQARITTPIDGSTYIWRDGDSFLCEDCLQISLRPETSSVYTFEAKHPNGCLSTFEAKVSAFRNPIGLLTMTADTIICKSSIIPLQADAKEDVYSYRWDTSRIGLSCYQNCRNPLASPDTTTTYIVIVSNGQGCERIDSVIVYVNTPGGLDLGPDRTLCPGDSFKISVPGYLDYRWSGSSGISCTNCADPVLMPLKESLFILNATEDGCSVMDSIRIRLFSGNLIVGRKDTTLCIGSSVQLKTVDQIGLKWLPSPWLNDLTVKNPIAKPQSDAVFYVQAIEDLCTVLDSFTVRVLKQTEISARDKTVCPGAEFSLTVQGDATSFRWDGPNIKSGQNTNSIQASTQKDVLYKVIAQNHTCASDTATIRVSVVSFLDLPEKLRVQVIKSLPFQLNQNFKPDSSFQYSWTPGDDLSCTDCLRPIVFTDTSKNYIFQIFDPATGCELTQAVEVSVIKRCQAEDFFSIPNIFTPNQDGLNDQLFILPKAADLIKSFRIFDRTGDLVFETYDLHIGWDGRLKNTAVANGVYVYLIEAECPQINQRIILTGDVTLIR